MTTPVEDEAGELVEAAGHFRIYLGAAAGVGKTYAMLSEGRRRHERGTDVVVGFVESHGRVHTEAMTEGLEVVPRKSVTYRGTQFEEMDLEAVINRAPKVALVDELAHSNVPGSGPHAKRWEDVLDLLAAGIDVVTTVNIQHLESIADAVEEMTGTPVRERVPDWVVRRADQIELVDSSPEQLRRRMVHGNIYAPEKVPQALSHFFRADNLTALREIALRFLADETEEELLEHLDRRNRAGHWETKERILVGVTGAPGVDAIVRRAARMTARVKGELHVVHVTGSDSAPGAVQRDAIVALRKLAEDVGATWHEVQGDHPAEALMEVARRKRITQIVVGSSQRSRWRELAGGGSIVRKVERLAGGAGIDVHIIARRNVESTDGGDGDSVGMDISAPD